MRFRLPDLNGYLPCRKVLTKPHLGCVLDAICAHYVDVPRSDWQQRFAIGHVFDACGNRLQPEAPFRAPLELHYYRPFHEQPLPVQETILYQDEHLVAVDKPHFLPVHPAGKYREETLVARVIARLGNPELSPLHRLDRATAGVVLFSCNRTSRGAYQNLFRDRSMHKRYEALAAPLPELAFPLERSSRLQRHADGFRSQEAAGEPNAHTRIEVIDNRGPLWRYALYPTSGQMHQLRVHMSALGAPIANDPWYPDALPSGPDDFDRPLQLLAQSLRFIDPVTQTTREFCTRLKLQSPP